MKDQDIIKAVAELDGKWQHLKKCGWSDEVCCEELMKWSKNYTHSRDAIIPVIEKLRYPSTEVQWKIFQMELSVIIVKENHVGVDSVSHVFELICATPRQLCEALLKATGKWVE